MTDETKPGPEEVVRMFIDAKTAADTCRARRAAYQNREPWERLTEALRVASEAAARGLASVSVCNPVDAEDRRLLVGALEAQGFRVEALDSHTLFVGWA